MNGEGKEEGVVNMDVHNEKLVYMWGYLPGALPQRSPILSPLAVRSTVYAWKDVCGGGCGFAMAISGDFSLKALSIFFNFFSWVVQRLHTGMTLTWVMMEKWRVFQYI